MTFEENLIFYFIKQKNLVITSLMCFRMKLKHIENHFLNWVVKTQLAAAMDGGGLGGGGLGGGFRGPPLPHRLSLGRRAPGRFPRSRKPFSWTKLFLWTFVSSVFSFYKVVFDQRKWVISEGNVPFVVSYFLFSLKVKAWSTKNCQSLNSIIYKAEGFVLKR